MTPSERIEGAVRFLRAQGFGGPFACAIVLGTGFGPIADRLTEATSLPYSAIPHFPVAAVSGHAGHLVAGRLADRRVLVFSGRAHPYEAGDPGAMRIPIGVAAALGARALLLTNAAGSLRSGLPPGRHVIVTDHINLTGLNPLVGEPDERRFVPMTGAYDETLRTRLAEAAATVGVAVGEGVYMWFPGPSFETPAEIRAARVLGADLVGMSTVPEVVLARFHGLPVAALSLVTNLAAGLGPEAPTHAETKRAAAEASSAALRLISAFVSRLEPV